MVKSFSSGTSSSQLPCRSDVSIRLQDIGPKMKYQVHLILSLFQTQTQTQVFLQKTDDF